MPPSANPDCAVFGRLMVKRYSDRRSLGIAAASHVAQSLAQTIAGKGEARVIFACAPSQNDFLEALTNPRSDVPVDWTKVTAFHMDEYVGLGSTHAQSFRSYLRSHLLDRVKVGRFYPLEGERPDLDVVIREYSYRLAEKPIDLICLGIGENGHIAFNDPGVADFEDRQLVKVAELDQACRQQQVNDGCFATLGEVPRLAVTLTVPVFRAARELSIHVPGARKAAAVRSALVGSINASCPASVLRLHENARMYVDRESGSGLEL
jgi:glucosamine-6-phosphate deaminase